MTATYATQSVPTTDSVRGRAAPIDKVLADAVTRQDIPGVVAIAADRRGILATRERLVSRTWGVPARFSTATD